MKKALSGAVAVLLALGGVALASAPANATPPPIETCVPADAWTETVESDLYKGLPVGEFTTFAVTDTDCEVVVPAQPEPVVTVVDEEVVDCEAGTVTTTTTTTTTGWVYDEESNTWIEGEPEVVVTSDEREATAEECPVVVEPTPTPTVPAVVTPADPAASKSASADTLAQTGADGLATVGMLTAGALALALGSLGVVLGLRRRQIAQQD